MRLSADEGVERAIVDRLRHEGYEVQYMAEMDPGVTDEFILEQANRIEALLITADKDFGELVYRLGRIHHGVILLRLAGLPDPIKAEMVLEALAKYAEEIAFRFTVLSPGLVRIRSRSEPN